MKKIRGYKRRLREIERWRIDNLSLNMDYLRERQRDYVKFRIYPWTPVAMSLSRFPTPKGKVKRRIIESMLDIFERWQKQLEEIKEPYYLKIWLFEPDVYNSQVVCAIGDCLHFYDNTFYKPDSIRGFRAENYGQISTRLLGYKWDFRFFESEIFESDYARENFKTEEEFIAARKEFEKKIKKPHRITEVKFRGKSDKLYMINTGSVWIG
jgi:hypothetical protein